MDYLGAHIIHVVITTNVQKAAKPHMQIKAAKPRTDTALFMLGVQQSSSGGPFFFLGHLLLW